MLDLTVIVPTFNEAENIGNLVGQLRTVLADIDAEILFVDDSTDKTPAMVGAAMAESGLPVRLLHRDQPRGGLAGAVVEGINNSTSEWVIVLDGDLQHPPAAAGLLFSAAQRNHVDVVVASRYVAGGSAGGLDGRLRVVVSRASAHLSKALFPHRLAGCSDPMSGFFALRRGAVDMDSVTQCGYKILLAILAHRGLTLCEIPFSFAARAHGESKASLSEGVRFLRLLVLLRSGRSRTGATDERVCPIAVQRRVPIANSGDAE